MYRCRKCGSRKLSPEQEEIYYQAVIDSYKAYQRLELAEASKLAEKAKAILQQQQR